MIDQAERLDTQDEITEGLPTLISTSTYENSQETSCSSITHHNSCRVHTKVALKAGKQLRCIWCSRIHLISDRKATIMCKECGVGFCRDETGRACWSHHIAYGGIPEAPSRGTKKRKANEL
mgnify:CR=1 FL=1